MGESLHDQFVGWVNMCRDYLVSFASTELRRFNIVLRGLARMEAYLSGGLRGGVLRFNYVVVVKPLNIDVSRRLVGSLNTCVDEFTVRDGVVSYDSGRVKGGLSPACRSLLDSMASAWHNLNVMNVFLAMIDPKLRGTPLIRGRIYADGDALVFDSDLTLKVDGMGLDVEYMITPLHLDGERVRAGVAWVRRKNP